MARQSNMTTHAVDWARLARSIDIVREHHGLTDRQLAQHLDFSPSTLSRLRRGEHVDADTVATLIAWLNPGRTPAWIVPKEPAPCPRIAASKNSPASSPPAAASTSTPPTLTNKPS
jgi:transcriptional regulator with XRE-family HTH domain